LLQAHVGRLTGERSLKVALVISAWDVIERASESDRNQWSPESYLAKQVPCHGRW
jgi:hypothetical protein